MIDPIRTLNEVIEESERHTKLMVQTGLDVMYKRLTEDPNNRDMRIGTYRELMAIGRVYGMDMEANERRLNDYIRGIK